MKNSKNYILSICIPTYNRSPYLKRLIDTIVNQKGFCDKISIVIADGPSSDDTEQMVAIYMQKYSNIIYYRNHINIGMTRALLEVVSYSEGQYTRMIGSDDQISNFSLEQMLDVIKKESPKLILSNLFPYKHEDEIVSCKHTGTYSLFQGFEQMAFHMGGQKYDKNKFGFEQHFTFMSDFCFETKFFNDSLEKTIEKKGKKYLEANYFNYIYVIFGFLGTKTIVLLDDEFILLHMKNSTMRTPNMKIYRDLVDLFQLINITYSIPSSFLKFEKKIDNYIYQEMYKGKYIYPIIFITKKLGLYKTLSYIWRKYFLKTI